MAEQSKLTVWDLGLPRNQVWKPDPTKRLLMLADAGDWVQVAAINHTGVVYLVQMAGIARLFSFYEGHAHKYVFRYESYDEVEDDPL